MRSSIFFVLIVNALLARGSLGLQCYSCNSGSNPNCGFPMDNPGSVPVTTCSGTCVIFKNSFDDHIYRGCSTQNLYVPDYLKLKTNENECFYDEFSEALYCSCATDRCNLNNLGTKEIYDINECLSDPCINGGECVDRYSKFQCNCPGNFGGERCEACIPNYRGANCEILDYCFGKTCSNNGVCRNVTTTYECTCNLGFHGRDCETPNFVCTTVGNFPDPVYCANYYACSLVNGVLTSRPVACARTTTTTGMVIQYLYSPSNRNCVLPTRFVPYAGQTCTR